jgi:hypothetical protein
MKSKNNKNISVIKKTIEIIDYKTKDKTIYTGILKDNLWNKIIDELNTISKNTNINIKNALIYLKYIMCTVNKNNDTINVELFLNFLYCVNNLCVNDIDTTCINSNINGWIKDIIKIADENNKFSYTEIVRKENNLYDDINNIYIDSIINNLGKITNDEKWKLVVDYLLKYTIFDKDVKSLMNTSISGTFFDVDFNVLNKNMSTMLTEIKKDNIDINDPDYKKDNIDINDPDYKKKAIKIKLLYIINQYYKINDKYKKINDIDVLYKTNKGEIEGYIKKVIDTKDINSFKIECKSLLDNGFFVNKFGDSYSLLSSIYNSSIELNYDCEQLNYNNLMVELATNLLIKPDISEDCIAIKILHIYRDKISESKNNNVKNKIDELYKKCNNTQIGGYNNQKKYRLVYN